MPRAAVLTTAILALLLDGGLGQTTSRLARHAVLAPSSPPPDDISGQPAICSRKLVLWAHHKTGSVMARAAVRAMNPVFNELCNTSYSQVALEVEPRPEDKLAKMLHPPNGAGMCLLHLSRDPLEVVVSGMMYHRRADEKWALRPMDSLTEEHIATEPLWTQVYLRGIALVAAVASSPARPYGAALALPHAGESYSAYLRRVPSSNGLLAEFIAANHTRLPFQEAVARAMAGGVAAGGGASQALSPLPCGASACLPAFTGSLGGCEAAWAQALEAMGVTRAGWASRLAAAAALKACPASPLAAGTSLKHSSQRPEGKLRPSAEKSSRPLDHNLGHGLGHGRRLGQRDGATLPRDETPADMARQLEVLDATLLGGRLKALAAVAGCPRSPQYGGEQPRLEPRLEPRPALGAALGASLGAALGAAPSPELARLVDLSRGSDQFDPRARKARKRASLLSAREGQRTHVGTYL